MNAECFAHRVLDPELWPGSRGRLSSWVNEMRPLKSSTRRTTKIRLPLGGRTSIGSFTSSTYVQSVLLRHSITTSFQTELAINTHMLACRYPSQGCGRSGGCYRPTSISKHSFLFVIDKTLIVLEAQARSVFAKCGGPQSYVCVVSL